MTPVLKINPLHGKLLAEFYEKAPHEPHHPSVQAAYKALIDEMEPHFKDMIKQGFRFSIINPGDPNPYKSSQDLHNDIERNKHIWIVPVMQSNTLKFEDGHPLIAKTRFKIGDYALTWADILHILQDYRGHYLGGQLPFGLKGEIAAYLAHKKDYSPLAQKALAAEILLPHSMHYFFNKQNENGYTIKKAVYVPDWIMSANWHEE